RLVSNGKLTDCQIPTLAEALRAVKGRIMINLDIKTGRIREILAICEQEQVVDQVIFKHQYFPGLLDVPGLIYMPRVTTLEELEYFLDTMSPTAVEIIAPTPDHPLMTQGIQMILEAGGRVWVNALWNGRESGGWGDEQAVLQPSTYGELVDRGVSIIQTDELGLLINYLRSRDLHSGEQQPVLYGAKIDPEEISTGEVTFQVGVLDPQQEVNEVMAYLRMNWKSFYVQLSDNGMDGDAIANDGIWSAQYDTTALRQTCINYASYGYEFGKDFAWDFYAVDTDGYLLTVLGGSGLEVPITVSASLVILE
ncbi:glycerophosphodiester phosphodiesterase family protein, partial [Candidatus Bipolaricaulota bacterium]